MCQLHPWHKTGGIDCEGTPTRTAEEESEDPDPGRKDSQLMSLQGGPDVLQCDTSKYSQGHDGWILGLDQPHAQCNCDHALGER